MTDPTDTSETAVLLALVSRFPYGVAARDIADYLGTTNGHAVAGKLRRLRDAGLAEATGDGKWYATSASDRAVELLWGAPTDTMERATALAEKYGEAIVRISDILSDRAVPELARIRKAQVIVAGLDSGEASDDG